jgi:hypothetical protein
MAGVVLNGIHALSYAYGGGKVIYGIDVADGALRRCGIP